MPFILGDAEVDDANADVLIQGPSLPSHDPKCYCIKAARHVEVSCFMRRTFGSPCLQGFHLEQQRRTIMTTLRQCNCTTEEQCNVPMGNGIPEILSVHNMYLV